MVTSTRNANILARAAPGQGGQERDAALAHVRQKEQAS